MNERIKIVDEISGTPTVTIRTDDEYATLVEIRAYDYAVRVGLRPTWTDDNKVYVSIEEREEGWSEELTISEWKEEKL